MYLGVAETTYISIYAHIEYMYIPVLALLMRNVASRLLGLVVADGDAHRMIIDSVP